MSRPKPKKRNPMSSWQNVLELDSNRTVRDGNPERLREAVGRGADLRIYTEFRYNEHIDTTSDNSELVTEVSDFRVTYLLERGLLERGRWAAGIMSQRMPIEPPCGFGPRASMSFFLYNEDGRQAIARPYLDGASLSESPILGPSPPEDFSDMPKYHQFDRFDAESNAPSSNFVYDFEVYRFWVRDEWEEILVHDGDGTVRYGSLEALIDAFSSGREIKVAVGGLCDDLFMKTSGSPEQSAPAHEVFVHTGPGYYCTRRRLFTAGTQPVVRVCPGVPMGYTSGGWDFGWLMPRTDGFLALWLCNPYTLKFEKSRKQCPMRWFVR
jgi:hypothetical protein